MVKNIFRTIFLKSCVEEKEYREKKQIFDSKC